MFFFLAGLYKLFCTYLYINEGTDFPTNQKRVFLLFPLFPFTNLCSLDDSFTDDNPSSIYNYYCNMCNIFTSVVMVRQQHENDYYATKKDKSLTITRDDDLNETISSRIINKDIIIENNKIKLNSNHSDSLLPFDVLSNKIPFIVKHHEHHHNRSLIVGNDRRFCVYNDTSLRHAILKASTKGPYYTTIHICVALIKIYSRLIVHNRWIRLSCNRSRRSFNSSSQQQQQCIIDGQYQYRFIYGIKSIIIINDIIFARSSYSYLSTRKTAAAIHFENSNITMIHINFRKNHLLSHLLNITSSESVYGQPLQSRHIRK